MMKAILLHSLVISCCILLSYCGGGGGGGGASEGSPSAVSLRLTPNRIDSGDRLTVRLEFTDIQASEVNGVIVKVQYPTPLDYLASSALISISGDESVPITPTGFRATPNDFLLFYLDTGQVDLNDRRAWIEFELVGAGAVEEGEVSVDVDAADSDTRADFDSDNPLFSAEDQMEVRVTEDDRVTPTPTPSPTAETTPTATPTAAE